MNEQALSINPCNCASQDIIFHLEKYGLYFDKIRAFFVPSLEHRIQSLLEEFVYSINSRWAKLFPCFKKFVDAIIIWKESLNRVAEYDISMMEEIMKNTIKRIIKDDVVTCFLDSVILHHRLNKVCCELDALGIKANILQNLNVWNFVNERNYLLDHSCFMNFNTMLDCNMNLNTVLCNSKRSIKCKKAIKPLTKNAYRNTKHMRPTMSEYQDYQIDLNRNFQQKTFKNVQHKSNHYSTCVATGSQNDNTNKINKSFNEKSCNTESKKVQNDLKLKIIVHKVYLEDYKYFTFSSSNITRLPLPCKSSNLIRRIFEADPSLTESCLIVMKRKFQDSMYNVCSCLNSILEKLNIKLTKALCLNCEIYPGYISFKLKANNIKKYLFVARVPICQNVLKYTIQPDFSILSSNSKSSAQINESKYFEQCKDDGTNFNDTLEYVEGEKFDTHYSQLDRSFIKDVMIDMSHKNEAENSNEKKMTCIIADNVSKYIQNLAVFSCNNSRKDIGEEISNMTTSIDNCEERNRKYCKILNSIEINCNECDNVEKCRKKVLESNNSIIKNDTQLVNNAICTCSSHNFIETSNEIEDIFSNKDLDSFSQTTGTYEHDWTCLSNKKSNLENEVCNTNRCSITSFVQNSEYDKQLVELNCNRFSNNNINTVDKQFDTQENDSSLNSAKVEIGCNSCSCRCDDIIDIIVIDNISKENIVCVFEKSQNNFDAVTARNTDYSKTMQISSNRNNNLLTVQMPRSKILSKEINVSTCYPRTVWLTSEDDKNISVTETSNGCNEIANFSTQTSIVSKKGNKILSDINKEILDMEDGTQDFTSPERFSTSKGRFRSSRDSRSFDISTEEYLRAKNHSTYVTSNASLYCRSFASTSEFTMSDRRDEFQKLKFRERECMRSRNDIHNVTSATIKHTTASRRYLNDSAKIRSQMILAMTKFRNSIDKIKRLIRAKLRRTLFNNKINNNNKMTKTFWGNKESSEDTRRKKTSGKYIRQGYSITSCSTCDCRRQSCTTSRESSNVILSIHRTKGKKCEENIKFHDYRLVDDNKTLLSFRSIKTSPWSYDLLISATEDIEKQKLNRNNRPRHDRRKKNGNVINYNKYSHRCDLKNLETGITISSQSTKVSLRENDSKYFGHYTRKWQDETCDDKHICKEMHNQDHHENEQMWHEYGQCENKNKYRNVPIKSSNVNSSEFLETLSHTWRRNARNVHKQFYDISELRNVKGFARKNQIFEKDMSDRFDDSVRSNDNLRKRHIFAILINACNDCMDDLDIDFKLRLLRYIELCKSIKRSLMRMLQPDDIYEISTASMFDSDL